MNLILSDVEETIMIVDPEATEHGQSVVNVRAAVSWMVIGAHEGYTLTGRKTENGYAFRERGWRYSGMQPDPFPSVHCGI